MIAKFCVAIVSVVCLLLSMSVKAQDAPDILFISIDDLNDWVGVLGGHPHSRTPNIDALAARGMLFANAHAVSAACLPSRTATLTGLSPFTTGIYDQGGGDWRENATTRDAITIPAFFRQNQYLTLGAGKLFHAATFGGEFAFEGYNDRNAWDGYFPSLVRQLPDEVRPPPRQIPNGGQGSPRAEGNLDWHYTVTEDYAMGDGQVAHWVGQQLEAESVGPRFIAAGIYRPHLPWYVPQEYLDMHPLADVVLPAYKEGDMDDVPSSALDGFNGLETATWFKEQGSETIREAVQGYLASISFADAMVGEIIAALDRSGQADNTIIVLWSDHGFHLGEKDRWRKMTVWEESIRVPLIVVAPGVTTAGSVSTEAVSLLDIYPTLVELAGLESSQRLDGQSLVPLLKDPERSWDSVAISTYGLNFTVRDDRFRYIVYEDGQEELYDHVSDPNEWNNLANSLQYAARKAELAARLPPPEERAMPIVTPIPAGVMIGRGAGPGR